jgi:hypothetical protein
MAETAEDSAVADFLQILEEHRRNCERQGKYVEAEIAKNRLEELKVHEENRRKEAMRSRQLAERLGVEEAHMLEYQQVVKRKKRNLGLSVLLTSPFHFGVQPVSDTSFCVLVIYFLLQFNMDWDRKMGEYEGHASDLVESMRQRHQVDDALIFYGLHGAHFCLPVLKSDIGCRKRNVSSWCRSQRPLPQQTPPHHFFFIVRI